MKQRDGLLWPPQTLELFDDTQISFAGGALHGYWALNETVLMVDFHWAAKTDQTKLHTFQPIGNTSTFILIQVGTTSRTNAVLVPMLESPILGGDGDEPPGKRLRALCM